MATTREKRGNPFKRFIVRLIKGKPELWPKPEINDEPDPVFLFVLTPPYCGSTALAKILDTSYSGMTLNDSGEGQWLVPGLRQLATSQHLGKWNHDMPVDWESVRRVWLRIFQAAKQSNNKLEVVIEKSPPNLVRPQQFADNFPTATFLGFVRNPYGSCASIFHRRRDPRNLIAFLRAKKYRAIAKGWVSKSQYIKNFVEQSGIEWFTYEKFCADTASCVAQINIACPALKGIDPAGKIKVKSYKEQQIVDQNPRQISLLSPADIKAINSVLSQHPDLLDFFGYQLISD